jgi:single-strand DNA-binding protein
MHGTFVVGNLGADPELKQLEGGTSICTLRIAANDRIKKNGEWVDHSEWYNGKVFGAKAEACAKYLKKGSKVSAFGKLRTSTYEKDGVTKYFTEYIIDTIDFIGTKQDGESAKKQGNYETAAADDDIPF